MRTNQQKLGSPLGYVSVYDCADEPARKPVRGRVCETSAPGSEFEVGCATSVEDIPLRVSRRTPFGGCDWKLVLIILFILVVFPACICNCVFFCRHWRRDGWRWGRRSVRWCEVWEQSAQETSCCLQMTGTARWCSKHCLHAVYWNQSKSRERLEKAYGEGKLCSEWVKLLYYSSIVPCFWLCFPVSDQYPRDTSSALFKPRASTNVSVFFHGGRRQVSTLGSTHDQLVSPELFRMAPHFLGSWFV